MDVTNRDSIYSVLSSANSLGSRIDILINNAAINPKVTSSGAVSNSSRFENYPLELWDLELDVGLKGAFLCSQVFGTAMASDNLGGVILNISSDLSVIAPDQRLYQNPYQMITFNQSLILLLKQLIGSHDTCCILNDGIHEAPFQVLLDQDADFVSKLSNLIPLGRMANVHEYRSSIQYLCSDASSYMTGHNMVVDGGRSVL